ncbi:polysaccharide deacetylase family protein [Chitinophaga sp. LS1]|uniref:polysaccharide deacetylase family protein n=1 Tax=Chitinophaga sp. LS1 TaxID=3051176 RepID=UPI002AAAD327|nr:polysaccharide deacetylase family protein [Chitinophaga sp. LS1]WPV64620.1 polysaccharide deacetylase family protein [Chitinophaga sp. LS1]
MGYTIIYMLLSYCLQYQQVPILCYHNISKADDGKEDLLHISEKHFQQQMQYLYNNGYTAITPDGLYAHMNGGAPLPSKSIMITFDDSHETHYSLAVPVLNQFHFRGVFFIMTVCLNKTGWLTASEIRDMSDQGHIIACHTWDHTNLALHPSYNVNEQIVKPKALLEKITGTSVCYFAFPYGEWNEQAIKDLKQANYIGAFQLASHQQSTDPNFTVRRIMVSGKWTAVQLKEAIDKAFILP